MSEKRRQDLVYPPGPETQRAQDKKGHRLEAEVPTTTGRLLARFSFIRHDEEAILQVLRQVPRIDRLHARIALFQALGGQYTNAGPRALALCERVFGSGTMYFPSEREMVERKEQPSPETPVPSRAAEPEPKPEPVLEPETAFDQGRIQTLCKLLKRLVSQQPFPPASEILALLDAAESHVTKAALSRLNSTLLPGEDRYGKTYYQSLKLAAGETVSDHLTGRREMIERMIPGWHKAGRPKNPPPLPLETRLLNRGAQFGVGQLLGSWDKSATPEAKAQHHAEAEQRLVEDHPALAILDEGGGELLPEAVLARMNRLLGHDFSHVRIHTDARAAEAAELLGARALAFGTHIYFGVGQFAPGTPVGDRLLAHELVHVVQFDEGRLPAGRNTGLEVSRPDDGTEREAEARAQSLGGVLPVAVLGPPADHLRSPQVDKVRSRPDPSEGVGDGVRVDHEREVGPIPGHVSYPLDAGGRGRIEGAFGAGLRLHRNGGDEEHTVQPVEEHVVGTTDPATQGRPPPPSVSMRLVLRQQRAGRQPPPSSVSTQPADQFDITMLQAADWHNASAGACLFILGRMEGSDETRVFVLPARGFVFHPTVQAPVAPRAPRTHRSPLAALPAVGHAGMMLVNTGSGTGVLVGVAGDPAGRPLSVLLPAGLQRIQQQLGITRIDDVLISHTHADHVGGLSTLVRRGNITGNRIWVYPGVALAGPLAQEIQRLATGTVAPHIPAGWTPNTLTTRAAPHATGRTTTQATLTVGNVTMRVVTDTDRLRRFLDAVAAGDWSRATRLADAASGLTRISSTQASAEILDIPDLRGRDIERLYQTMGDADFHQFVRGVRILDGIHHLGAVSTEADMRGWRLLFNAISEGGTRPFTVMAQTGPPFPVNEQLIRAIQMAGGRVIEVGAPDPSRPDAAITVRAGGQVVQRGGREWGIDPQTRQAQERLERMERALRVLEELPEYRGHATLSRAHVIQGLREQAARLRRLLAERLDLSMRDLHTGGPRMTTQTELQANTAAMMRVEGVEQSLGSDALQRLARSDPEIDEIQRQARAARARGASSQRLLQLLAQVDPHIARDIMIEETGRPMSRNQMRAAMRRVQARLRRQARTEQAMRMTSGGTARARSAAWFGLFMEAWNLAAPFIEQTLRESRDQSREDFHRFFRALFWWHEKGIHPVIAGQRSGRELPAPQLGPSIERRLYEDIPEAQRSDVALSSEARQAQPLELLYIPELNTWTQEQRDAFFATLRHWASAHINNYDDYAAEFSEGLSPPIRQTPGQQPNFGHNNWQILVGVVHDGHVEGIWQDSGELTRIMNAAAQRAIAGTERHIEQHIEESRHPAPDLSTIGPVDAPTPTRRSQAVTRRVRFSGTSRAIFSERNQQAVAVSGFRFWNDSPRLLELGNRPAPRGYVWVTGGDYNTWAALRDATVWTQVGLVRIPRQPPARLHEPFRPPDEEYMNREELAAWRAWQYRTEGFYFQEEPTTMYRGWVNIFQEGPNLSARVLVRTGDIRAE